MRINLLNIDNSLYLLKRKFRIETIKNVQEFKQNLHCDIVFKKNNYYYFCDIIEDAEIIYYELCSEKEITKLVKEIKASEEKLSDEEIMQKLEKQNINNEMLQYVLSKLKGDKNEKQKIS